MRFDEMTPGTVVGWIKAMHGVRYTMHYIEGA